MIRTIATCEVAFFPITGEELKESLKHLTMDKASELDSISTEMIKHFGPKKHYIAFKSL